MKFRYSITNRQEILRIRNYLVSRKIRYDVDIDFEDMCIIYTVR